MRQQRFFWAFLVITILATGYGGFMLIYNFRQGKGLSTLALILLIIGLVMLALYIAFYIYQRRMKWKSSVKSGPAKKEEPVKQEETVRIRIPREKKDQEDKVVWVNNQRYVIQRGVSVDVPVSVAEVLEHEERMLEKQYDFESKVQK